MLDDSLAHLVVCPRIGGRPGGEAVDVAVVHAEGCRDEDGVVDLEIGRTFGPCCFDVRARDALAVDRNLAGNVQECAKLGLDRRAVGVALDLFDQLDSAIELDGGEGAV